MIQKCFPTLNIRIEDNLSKDICRKCHKQLESFTRFIEEVYCAQTKLELQSNSKRLSEKCNRNERMLNIKQEPIVRVKQEITDEIHSDHSHNSDELDLEIDNNGMLDVDDFEEKFNFNHFPNINTRDIINNCDIMEIVNLDDAFIDIPDDDVDSLIGPFNKWLQQDKIIEEHCYASLTDKILKSEIEVYKTEIETDDYLEEILPSLAEEEHFFDNMTVSEVQEVTTNIITKPQLNENQAIITEINELPTSTKRHHHNRPNIVVLNESIVKSANNFQLHTCHLCQTKYFSFESLEQHFMEKHSTYNISNAKLPMVSVPQENIITNTTNNYDDIQRNFKIEKDLSSNLMSNILQFEHEDEPLNENYFHNYDMRELVKTTSPTILKVQNLNVTHQQEEDEEEDEEAEGEQYEEQEEELELLPEQEEMQINRNLQEENGNDEINSLTQQQQENISNHVDRILKKKHMRIMQRYYNKIMQKTNAKMRLLNRLANNYKKLTRNFHKLQNKCTNLEENMTNWKREEETKLNIITNTNFNKSYKCYKCLNSFSNIYQLLQHKQQEKHFFRKISNHFKTLYCIDCGQRFFKYLALRNHRRYICKSLLPHRLPTKCKYLCCFYCKVTFTHLRLLRQHEMNCNERSKLINSNKLPKCNCSHKRTFNCKLCKSVFKQRQGLKQHIRAIHLQIRPFVCKTCDRQFALKSDMMRCRHSRRAYKYNVGVHLNVNEYKSGIEAEELIDFVVESP